MLTILPFLFFAAQARDGAIHGETGSAARFAHGSSSFNATVVDDVQSYDAIRRKKSYHHSSRPSRSMHGDAKKDGFDPIFGGSNRPERRAVSAPRWSKAKNQWVSPSKAGAAPASAGGQGYTKGSLFSSLGQDPEGRGGGGDGTHRRQGTDLHTGAAITQRGLWRSDSAPATGPSQFAMHGGH